MNNIEWFKDARFGAFIHFGVFSMLGHGEWVMNREQIMPNEYRKLAQDFNPDKFDADEICALAKNAGAGYIVFTTMHHEGFRMYDSDLSDYNSVNFCGRDFTAEMISAARKYELKIGLYHSLNNWYDQPDAVDALEDRGKYELFIENSMARIKELVTKYNPIDILWYDGWWPFNAEGWQAEKMNAMVSEIQPQIIFNGRNCLPGDFGTPEGHISAPTPWRPWEACMTLNDSWGYHRGDTNWKSPTEVVDMLTKVANGNGNLLLNIGPKGDGSIPAKTVEIFEEVGMWMNKYSEAIFNTDIFTFDLHEQAGYRGDWSHLGVMTASGNNLYLRIKAPTGDDTLTLAGLSNSVKSVTLLGDDLEFPFEFANGKLTILNMSALPTDLKPGAVLKITCNGEAAIYISGGMRTPNVPHPHYDPVESDIQN